MFASALGTYLPLVNAIKFVVHEAKEGICVKADVVLHTKAQAQHCMSQPFANEWHDGKMKNEMVCL